MKSTALSILFCTILIDLIGFGIIIPIVGLYGRHFGCTQLQLSFLGGIYSFMQFLFSPIWGGLSDRIGRRPILLLSLFGLSISYFIFAYAPNFTWLFASRMLGGIFAANISTAQAYIADVTTLEDRAKGMGMLGAAFGIGFTLGPPLGGIAAKLFGLSAPGWIAGSICLINFFIATLRLPESHRHLGLHTTTLKKAILQNALLPFTLLKKPLLKILVINFFFVTLCFSMMEQLFSLLLQNKFHFDTQHTALNVGILLMYSSVLAALIQGLCIKMLVKKFSEKKLFLIGLTLQAIALSIFPFGTHYKSYFLILLPLTIGSSLINPSLSSLISKSAAQHLQGATLGVSQSFGSLARAIGPALAFPLFERSIFLPYLLSCLTLSVLWAINYKKI